MPPFSLGGDGGFSIAPDSKELAFTENPDAVPAISTSAQIYTLDLTHPGVKPVKVSTSAGGNFSPAYSPDGKWLAWRSQARAGYESDKFRLMLYDRVQRSIEYMLPKFDLWIDEFCWSPSSQAVYFTAGNIGETSIYALILKKATNLYKQAWRIQVFPKEVLAAGGDISGFYVPSEFGDLHFAGDEKTLLASRMTVRSPQEVVSIDVDRLERASCTCADDPQPVFGTLAAVTQVTHLNDTLLAQLDLPKMESFWFTAKDGVKVQGFVIRGPPGV